MSTRDYLGEILARKATEVARRRKRLGALERLASAQPIDPSRGARAIEALRRPEGAPLRIIGEVKFASPSKGVIRARRPGLGIERAQAYARGGVAAVSCLAAAPGFLGSPLEVRRVAGAVDRPVLFKEFVLDPAQVTLARVCGASMVLLLVRAHPPEALDAMVREVERQGMAPVVEAANADELDTAIETGATLVGVNARDLRTFRVDPVAAAQALAKTPADRVAIFMSGVGGPADLAPLADTRADAALVGESLMRADDAEAAARALAQPAEAGGETS